MNKYWIISLAILSTVSLSACSFGSDSTDIKTNKSNIDTVTSSSWVVYDKPSESVTSVNTKRWVVDPSNDLFWNASDAVKDNDEAVKALDAELKNLEVSGSVTVSSWVVK